jgi:GNAT superfamily N-acetyltransferase
MQIGEQQYTVRRSAMADQARINGLRRSMYCDLLDPELPEEPNDPTCGNISQDRELLVVLPWDESTALVAMGGIRRVSNTEAEVYSLLVANEHQRAGIGSCILNLLEGHATNMAGVNTMIVDATHAKYFFQRRGYKPRQASILSILEKTIAKPTRSI